MIICTLLSILLILLVLIDGFETILQPRRVVHRFRFARLFYRNIWRFWRTTALLIRAGKRREAYLGIFGPLSLLGLFTAWVFGLIFAFAILNWSIRTPLTAPEKPDDNSG